MFFFMGRKLKNWGKIIKSYFYWQYEKIDKLWVFYQV